MWLSALKITTVVAAIAIVVPLCITACWGRSLLYYPTHDDAAAVARSPWVTQSLSVADDIVLRGVVRPAGDPNASWLLFFGGNAMGLSAGVWALEQCRGSGSQGLAVFAYRGYDGSDGTPKQEALLADAEAIAAHLRSAFGVEPARLVIIGQSLGSGIAAHLAHHLAAAGTPARGLALLSPYTSMARVFDEQVPAIPVGWLAPDPYRTDRLVEGIPGPVVLIHGEADGLIPIAHSRDLAAAFGDKARLVALPKLGHNDLWDSRQTTVAIRVLALRR